MSKRFLNGLPFALLFCFMALLLLSCIGFYYDFFLGCWRSFQFFCDVIRTMPLYEWRVEELRNNYFKIIIAVGFHNETT